jgi:16S rRNA processing protein RimM
MCIRDRSYTDPREAIATRYRDWQLALGDRSERRTVVDWKRAGGAIAVQLEGIATVEAAAALRGAEVRVERSALPPAAPGEHYWHDLIGLDAFGLQGEPLGRVAGILELPAHPVLVLEGERERLVPLVPERLAGVDLDAGRLTLDWHPDD